MLRRFGPSSMRHPKRYARLKLANDKAILGKALCLLAS